MDNTQTQSIDPTALALKRSIFKTEGGDYTNTSGDSGTSAGAGQWNNGKIPLKKGEIPANFKSDAQQFGLDPNDFSETAQDHIGYLKIKKDLDSGLTQSQIAAKWNSGLTHGWENHVGDVQINGKTVHYDTPSYVDKVKKYYEEEMGGGTSETPKRKTFTESLTPPPAENKPQYTTPQHSPERIAQYNAEQQGLDKKAKEENSTGGIIGNTIKDFGDTSTLGGASALGEQLGTGFARTYNQAKGLLGYQDNSKYIPEMNFGKTTAGLAGTIGGILATAGGSGELKGFNSIKELTSPSILERLPKNLTPKVFLNLGKTEQLNILGNMFKEAEQTGARGDLVEITKALKKLEPSTGKIVKLLKAGGYTLGGVVLDKLLGNKVSGIIKSVL